MAPKNTCIILLACFIANGFMTPKANAQLILIPTDYPSIQTGIEAASDGDTVIVAENRYYENINFMGKAITVASHFILDGDTSHISKTIIDGSQPSHPDTASVVYFLSGEDTTSVLSGFTITGGSGTLWNGDEVKPLPGYRNGAGIFIWAAGAKISHNIIQGNRLNHPTNQPAKVTFDSLAMGAGIGASVGAHRNLIVVENTIENNVIASGNLGCGAGMFIEGGSADFIDINGNTVRENTIQTSYGMAVGGGIGYMNTYYESWTPNVLIRNNLVEKNTASGNPDSHWLVEFAAGGGMLINGYDNPLKLELYNNIVSENTCNYKGGGIAIELVDFELVNNTFVNNFAERGGNSIMVRYVDFLDYKDPGSTVALINNILWSDNGSTSEIVLDPGISFSAKYNLIRGGWEGDGNIDADPNFISGSYALSAYSPCVGSGRDSVVIDGSWFYAPPIDLLGSPRPDPIDKRVDLGAIESPFEGYVYIPDTAFLYALIEEGVDSNKDSLISFGEAEICTKLNVAGEGIADMSGIEAFKNLDSLVCFYNKLTSLDVSDNAGLSYLDCALNRLSKLDVKGCTKLKHLNCEHYRGQQVVPWSSNLSSLDLSGNPLLEHLNISHNILSNLDLSNNPELTHLLATGNELTSLDLSSNTKLDTLYCSGNNLESLNVTNCTMLAYMELSDNRLTGLDLSTNIALSAMYCERNSLTNLDVSQNLLLNHLQVGHNELSGLDLSNNTNLLTFTCDSNTITTLDLSNSISLWYLVCNGNPMTNLDLSNNINFEEIQLENMELLNEVCVWESFDQNSLDVRTSGSPGICFQTDCNGDCSEVGINDSDDSGFLIYPNPAHTLLHLETNYPAPIIIEITSINGQMMVEQKVEGCYHQLDLSPLRSGIYFITIRSMDFVTTRKIVKL